MWLLIFVVLGIFGTTRSAVAFGAEELCRSDNDCAENTFCYETSHLCAPCNPNYCSRFNRANSSWRKCHKEAKECGDCLEGYSEEILTDGTAREACILAPVSKKHATFQHSVMPAENQTSYLTFSIVAVFGFVVVGMAVYTQKRGYHHVILQRIPCPLEENGSRTDGQDLVTTSQRPKNYQLPPPPYNFPNRSFPQLSSGIIEEGSPLTQRSNSCVQVEEHLLSPPSAPLLTKNAEDIKLHACEESTFHQPESSSIETLEYKLHTIERRVECEKTCLLQAYPFKDPDYEKSPPSGSEDGISTSEDSQEENSDFGNLNFDDEATVPCHWTPASTSASVEQSNNDDICNASNIQLATKRVNSETEAPNSEPDSGSEKKRMKTHEQTFEQSEVEDRPFRCFSQNQNLNEQDHPRDEHSD